MAFLRGDVPVAERMAVIGLDRHALAEPAPHSLNAKTAAKNNFIAWHRLLGTTFSADATAAAAESWSYPSGYLLEGREARRLFPDDAERPVRVDASNGAMRVVSQRTCGIFGERGRLRAGALAVDIGDVPAAVWISSLDGEPLGRSWRMLLTHVTDVQCEGLRWEDAACRKLLSFGRKPFLVKNGFARIAVCVDGSPDGGAGFRVHALSFSGERRCEIPCTRTDRGLLSFVCDVARDRTDATCLYEIERIEK